MEPLLKQLRELGKRFNALSGAARFGIFAMGALAVVAAVLWSVSGAGAGYQYAFTNLSAEDSTEAATQLKAAKIPFRLEANGAALAVPANQVHDARLLLAAQGLPRGGGVGFELFDRGDLGVSEFTQRVNLRRALEGELGRTIGRLNAVRSARVHITLPEKGLYRDDDRRAAAAVVANLQPGRILSERELQGIRHLVSSAVGGLNPDAVTVMDGRGSMLAGKDSASAKAISEQRETERALETRVNELLEAAVGVGAVVTKVTASMDTTEVESTSDAYDPDTSVLRSARRTTEASAQNAPAPSGVAGAAANQPLGGAVGGAPVTNSGTSTRDDEVKNFEISKTVTRQVSRTPRLKRLSVAVLLDGVNGSARAPAEIARLAELAKSAVGFDPARGDRFEISSAPFPKTEEKPEPPAPWYKNITQSSYGPIAAGAIGLMLIVLMAGLMRWRADGRAATAQGMALLQPGARVRDLEAAMNRPEAASYLPAAAPLPQLADPNLQVRDRARHVASDDPARAAHVLKAWIDSDYEKREAGAGGRSR
jgi:flagellar M-ring protein FliF